MRIIVYLFYLELIVLLRRSQEWLYPLGFFLMVMSLFPLALNPDPDFLQTIFPGAIWIATLLANMMAIQTLFTSELEDNHIEQLLLSELPLSLLLTLKLFAKWITLILPLVLLTPILGLLYCANGSQILWVIVSLLLGTPILINISSCCAALTLGLRQQGILLSLLILPLVLPIILLSMSLIEHINLELNIAGLIAFLAAMNLFTTLLTPLLVAGILRISFDD